MLYIEISLPSMRYMQLAGLKQLSIEGLGHCLSHAAEPPIFLKRFDEFHVA